VRKEIKVPERRAVIYYDQYGNQGIRVPETQLPDNNLESIALMEAYSAIWPKDTSDATTIQEPKDTRLYTCVSIDKSPTDTSTKTIEKGSSTSSDGKKTSECESTSPSKSLSKRSHDEVLDDTKDDGRDDALIDRGNDDDNNDRKKKSPKLEQTDVPTNHPMPVDKQGAMSMIAPSKGKENPYRRKSTAAEAPSSKLSDASNTATRTTVESNGNQGASGKEVPKNNKPGEPSYIYKEVVRGKERKNLNGYCCEQCNNFYGAVCDAPGGHVFNREQLVSECSRHRHRFRPAQTPEGFWDLTFRDEKEDKNRS